ncbi:unnamed protein product [Sphagnum jensenii]|uniref:Uncharacterized protein n=1 Tax=Sphagnum jensenii TaxID=128206 RepID=A0ABP0W9B7_9BRYO
MVVQIMAAVGLLITSSEAASPQMDVVRVKSDPPAPPNSSTEALATTAVDPSPEQLHQPLIVRNDSTKGLDMAVNSTNV